MIRKLIICLMLSLGVYAVNLSIEMTCNDCMKKRLFIDMKCTVCGGSDIVCDNEHCVRNYCPTCDRMRVYSNGTNCDVCNGTEKYTDDTMSTPVE